MHWTSALPEILKHLIDPRWVIHHGGLYLMLGIIFAETGLFVGFFLPGDSLLFVAGMMGSRTDYPYPMHFIFVLLLVSAAGILGNVAGYWFGRESGPLLFHRKDGFLFKKRHLLAAKIFYDKHGGSAIIFARFLPFIRTFAPIVAGVVNMDFRKFGIFNIVGSTAWVCSIMIAGFFLGRTFPWLGEHLEGLVLIIALITGLPVVLKFAFLKKSPDSGSPSSS
jgi:membrane-associated protein